MSNIVDFERYAEERNLSPLVRYEKLIREVIKDINITVAPALTAEDKSVTLAWRSSNGSLGLTFNPASGSGVVYAKTKDKHISIQGAEVNIGDRLRWIGYLFDDCFHE